MAYVSIIVELTHALLMSAWVVGMPLLFVHRWPRLTRAYAVYALSFVVMSHASHYWLGHCFITLIARDLWEAAGTAPADVDQWFSVRLGKWVFGLAPSHRSIVIAWEVATVVTALGALWALRPGVRGVPVEPGRHHDGQALRPGITALR